MGYEKGKGRNWLENSAASNSQQPQVKAALDDASVYDASHLRKRFKVVDSDGKLLAFYHMTSKDFSEFSTGPALRYGHGQQEESGESVAGSYFLALLLKEQINEAIEQRVREEVGANAESQARTVAANRGAQGGADFSLTRQSSEEVAAAEREANERNVKAEADKRKADESERNAKIEKERKARADIAADAFTLTPAASTAADTKKADEKAADDQFAGQKDIFSAQPAQEPKHDAAMVDPDQGVALFNRNRSGFGTPVPRSVIDSIVSRVDWNANGQAVVVVDRFNDLSPPIVAYAKKSGYTNTNPKDRIGGVAYKGKVYLVQENLFSALDVEENLLHERLHNILRGNGKDTLVQAMNSLFLRMGRRQGAARPCAPAWIQVHYRQQASSMNQR